ncbi:very short patch repair endonuclease [Mycetocola zhadangensis]|uniref:very short patch repair endonuclease n=1 Tax=Mycetocola zhadangensis TaxID=1164595 RepID=UPI003A4DE7AF
MDNLTPLQRHKTMSRVRQKDTKPELKVRQALHKRGYRYRLHDRDLPGKPDVVFSRKRKVIFINGCFWHLHECPRGLSRPKTNVDFWQAKRTATRDRDQASIAKLQEAGWACLTIWECELRDFADVEALTIDFLES